MNKLVKYYLRAQQFEIGPNSKCALKFSLEGKCILELDAAYIQFAPKYDLWINEVTVGINHVLLKPIPAAAVEGYDLPLGKQRISCTQILRIAFENKSSESIHVICHPRAFEVKQ